MFDVVLVAPEIAPNTGNVARTCAVTGARLHLVRPLGFRLSDRMLRRAGMDYWEHVEWRVHDTWDELLAALPEARFCYLEPDGPVRYSDLAFAPGDVLVFGSESRGLPREFIRQRPGPVLRVPMRPGLRSLNLASTVALVLYEAYRQHGFPGLV
ncbi:MULTISPECIES: tRNA (cytidine(34)-2'-O)-methyltransferase [Thermaerobacter]|uniref:Putative tRNA (cytidine(34)-2'-O)-methyltransferase n=1 Tax=Thermaerobacter composti TaxID=554949 RepID=A0ABZ0QQS6_9FIRM|nr:MULTISPECIES: tRNA (cytidine(34)-2'-O)-methyltransferase [Thermaerobacter]PZN01817.1 MAG: tRNA (uridine(34)/cytosine(34)/5-carboxymethylaminomethyluridine(34)-2'-O)-methyltransferase TrmL [Bacillota bacterium]QBS37680.1 tRNA (cytidine(34)-2'-O)-methyltransferase [Thermaerobacter sp. FW80]WPD19816.1 tRNA (cytidine(34)-2'-O)-methyltransferase [Thermaerobacter composti]